MARSCTGEKRACFTLTFMAVATPEDEKIRKYRGRFQTCPGRFRDALGDLPPLGRFETCPKPRFVLTSEMFFTLNLVLDPFPGAAEVLDQDGREFFAVAGFQGGDDFFVVGDSG